MHASVWVHAGSDGLSVPCLQQQRDGVCAGPFLKMFQACTLVMRRDTQTAMFLLPYIVQVLSHAEAMHAYPHLWTACDCWGKEYLIEANCSVWQPAPSGGCRRACMMAACRSQLWPAAGVIQALPAQGVQPR